MIPCMNTQRLLLSILGIAFGGFMILYGGIDDSPGAQLLGLLAFIAGTIGAITKRKGSH